MRRSFAGASFGPKPVPVSRLTGMRTDNKPIKFQIHSKRLPLVQYSDDESVDSVAEPPNKAKSTKLTVQQDSLLDIPLPATSFSDTALKKLALYNSEDSDCDRTSDYLLSQNKKHLGISPLVDKPRLSRSEELVKTDSFPLHAIPIPISTPAASLRRHSKDKSSGERQHDEDNRKQQVADKKRRQSSDLDLKDESRALQKHLSEERHEDSKSKEKLGHKRSSDRHREKVVNEFCKTGVSQNHDQHKSKDDNTGVDEHRKSSQTHHQSLCEGKDRKSACEEEFQTKSSKSGHRSDSKRDSKLSEKGSASSKKITSDNRRSTRERCSHEEEELLQEEYADRKPNRRQSFNDELSGSTADQFEHTKRSGRKHTSKERNEDLFIQLVENKSSVQKHSKEERKAIQALYSHAIEDECHKRHSRGSDVSAEHHRRHSQDNGTAFIPVKDHKSRKEKFVGERLVQSSGSSHHRREPHDADLKPKKSVEQDQHSEITKCCQPMEESSHSSKHSRHHHSEELQPVKIVKPNLPDAKYSVSEFSSVVVTKKSISTPTDTLLSKEIDSADRRNKAAHLEQETISTPPRSLASVKKTESRSEMEDSRRKQGRNSKSLKENASVTPPSSSTAPSHNEPSRIDKLRTISFIDSRSAEKPSHSEAVLASTSVSRRHDSRKKELDSRKISESESSDSESSSDSNSSDSCTSVSTRSSPETRADKIKHGRNRRELVTDARKSTSDTVVGTKCKVDKESQFVTPSRLDRNIVKPTLIPLSMREQESSVKLATKPNQTETSSKLKPKSELKQLDVDVSQSVSLQRETSELIKSVSRKSLETTPTIAKSTVAESKSSISVTTQHDTLKDAKPAVRQSRSLEMVVTSRSVERQKGKKSHSHHSSSSSSGSGSDSGSSEESEDSSSSSGESSDEAVIRAQDNKPVHRHVSAKHKPCVDSQTKDATKHQTNQQKLSERREHSVAKSSKSSVDTESTTMGSSLPAENLFFTVALPPTIDKPVNVTQVNSCKKSDAFSIKEKKPVAATCKPSNRATQPPISSIVSKSSSAVVDNKLQGLVAAETVELYSPSSPTANWEEGDVGAMSGWSSSDDDEPPPPPPPPAPVPPVPVLSAPVPPAPVARPAASVAPPTSAHSSSKQGQTVSVQDSGSKRPVLQKLAGITGSSSVTSCTTNVTSDKPVRMSAPVSPVKTASASTLVKKKSTAAATQPTADEKDKKKRKFEEETSQCTVTTDNSQSQAKNISSNCSSLAPGSSQLAAGKSKPDTGKGKIGEGNVVKSVDNQQIVVSQSANSDQKSVKTTSKSQSDKRMAEKHKESGDERKKRKTKGSHSRRSSRSRGSRSRSYDRRRKSRRSRSHDERSRSRERRSVSGGRRRHRTRSRSRNRRRHESSVSDRSCSRSRVRSRSNSYDHRRHVHAREGNNRGDGIHASKSEGIVTEARVDGSEFRITMNSNGETYIILDDVDDIPLPGVDEISSKVLSDSGKPLVPPTPADIPLPSLGPKTVANPQPSTKPNATPLVNAVLVPTDIPLSTNTSNKSSVKHSDLDSKSAVVSTCLPPTDIPLPAVSSNPILKEVNSSSKPVNVKLSVDVSPTAGLQHSNDELSAGEHHEVSSCVESVDMELSNDGSNEPYSPSGDVIDKDCFDTIDNNKKQHGTLSCVVGVINTGYDIDGNQVSDVSSTTVSSPPAAAGAATFPTVGKIVLTLSDRKPQKTVEVLPSPVVSNFAWKRKLAGGLLSKPMKLSLSVGKTDDESPDRKDTETIQDDGLKEGNVSHSLYAGGADAIVAGSKIVTQVESGAVDSGSKLSNVERGWTNVGVLTAVNETTVKVMAAIVSPKQPASTLAAVASPVLAGPVAVKVGTREHRKSLDATSAASSGSARNIDVISASNRTCDITRRESVKPSSTSEPVHDTGLKRLLSVDADVCSDRRSSSDTRQHRRLSTDGQHATQSSVTNESATRDRSSMSGRSFTEDDLRDGRQKSKSSPRRSPSPGKLSSRQKPSESPRGSRYRSSADRHQSHGSPEVVKQFEPHSTGPTVDRLTDTGHTGSGHSVISSQSTQEKKPAGHSPRNTTREPESLTQDQKHEQSVSVRRHESTESHQRSAKIGSVLKEIVLMSSQRDGKQELESKSSETRGKLKHCWDQEERLPRKQSRSPNRTMFSDHRERELAERKADRRSSVSMDAIIKETVGKDHRRDKQELLGPSECLSHDVEKVGVRSLSGEGRERRTSSSLSGLDPVDKDKMERIYGFHSEHLSRDSQHGQDGRCSDSKLKPLHEEQVTSSSHSRSDDHYIRSLDRPLRPDDLHGGDHRKQMDSKLSASKEGHLKSPPGKLELNMRTPPCSRGRLLSSAEKLERIRRTPPPDDRKDQTSSQGRLLSSAEKLERIRRTPPPDDRKDQTSSQGRFLSSAEKLERIRRTPPPDDRKDHTSSQGRLLSSSEKLERIRRTPPPDDRKDHTSSQGRLLSSSEKLERIRRTPPPDDRKDQTSSQGRFLSSAEKLERIRRTPPPDDRKDHTSSQGRLLLSAEKLERIRRTPPPDDGKVRSNSQSRNELSGNRCRLSRERLDTGRDRSPKHSVAALFPQRSRRSPPPSSRSPGVRALSPIQRAKHRSPTPRTRYMSRSPDSQRRRRSVSRGRRSPSRDSVGRKFRQVRSPSHRRSSPLPVHRSPSCHKPHSTSHHRFRSSPRTSDLSPSRRRDRSPSYHRDRSLSRHRLRSSSRDRPRSPYRSGSPLSRRNRSSSCQRMRSGSRSRDRSVFGHKGRSPSRDRARSPSSHRDKSQCSRRVHSPSVVGKRDVSVQKVRESCSDRRDVLRSVSPDYKRRTSRSPVSSKFRHNLSPVSDRFPRSPKCRSRSPRLSRSPPVSVERLQEKCATRSPVSHDKDTDVDRATIYGTQVCYSDSTTRRLSGQIVDERNVIGVEPDVNWSVTDLVNNVAAGDQTTVFMPLPSVASFTESIHQQPQPGLQYTLMPPYAGSFPPGYAADAYPVGFQGPQNSWCLPGDGMALPFTPFAGPAVGGMGSMWSDPSILPMAMPSMAPVAGWHGPAASSEPLMSLRVQPTYPNRHVEHIGPADAHGGRRGSDLMEGYVSDGISPVRRGSFPSRNIDMKPGSSGLLKKVDGVEAKVIKSGIRVSEWRSLDTPDKSTSRKDNKSLPVITVSSTLQDNKSAHGTHGVPQIRVSDAGVERVSRVEMGERYQSSVETETLHGEESPPHCCLWEAIPVMSVDDFGSTVVETASDEREAAGKEKGKRRRTMSGDGSLSSRRRSSRLQSREEHKIGLDSGDIEKTGEDGITQDAKSTGDGDQVGKLPAKNLKERILGGYEAGGNLELEQGISVSEDSQCNVRLSQSDSAVCLKPVTDGIFNSPSPYLSPKPEKVKSRWRRWSELEKDGSERDSSLPPRTPLEQMENMSGAEMVPNSSESATEPVVEDQLPYFERIIDNIFLNSRDHLKKAHKEARRMVCDCVPPTYDEQIRGMRGCAEDCLNRMLLIECGARCPCGELCSNKLFQQHQYADVNHFKTHYKGWGLQASVDLVPGTFIMEYVGEVLDYREFKARTKRYARENYEHHYFMALTADEVIDATKKGNVSRLINHCCDPNAETQKWTVNGQLRIGFFAIKPIKAGDEITFDYQFETYGREATKCYCGVSNCRGYIDVSRLNENKGRRKVNKAKDKRKMAIFSDRLLEDEIEKMLLMDGLHRKDHVLELNRLMLRADSREHRLSLLKILQDTKEPACLRLFLDYQGLPLLWSWMADVLVVDYDFKSQILQTLKILPIGNKTVLRDSRILAVVEKWSQEMNNKLTAITPAADSTQSETASSTSTPPQSQTTEAGSQVVNRTVDEDIVSESDGTLDQTITGEQLQVESDVDLQLKVENMTEQRGGRIEELSSERLVDSGSDVETSTTGPQSEQTEQVSCTFVPHKKRHLLSHLSQVANDAATSGSESETPAEMSKADDTCSQEDEEGVMTAASVDSASVALSHDDDLTSVVSEEPSSVAVSKVDMTIVSDLATSLLNAWTNLKEAFKIPKLKAEERKKTEQELDLRCEERVSRKDLLSWDKGGAGWRRHSDDSPDVKRRRRDDTDDSKQRALKHLRQPLSTTSLELSKLSKQERRQQFEAQVKAQDELQQQQQQQQQLEALELQAQFQAAADFYNSCASSSQSLAELGYTADVTATAALPYLVGADMTQTTTTVLPFHVDSSTTGFSDYTGATTVSYVEPDSYYNETYQLAATQSLSCDQLHQSTVAMPTIAMPTGTMATGQSYPSTPVVMGSNAVYSVVVEGQQLYDVQTNMYYTAPPGGLVIPQGSNTIGSLLVQQVQQSGPTPGAASSQLVMAQNTTVSTNLLLANPPTVTHCVQLVPRDPRDPPTQSRDPCDPRDPPPPPPSPPPKVKGIRLPPNWKTAKDASGKVYYYHTVTRQTQWEPPAWDATGADEDEEDMEDMEDMDLGTPSYCESRESSHRRSTTTTAAADTSTEAAKRMKDQFRQQIAKHIVACLGPYRRPDCEQGRINTTKEFKKLARKLTHAVLSKELKHCRHLEDLEVNENVKGKAKDFVVKYMSKFPGMYRASNYSPL